MWILMNNSMLSIIRHRDRPDDLLVRARLAGDIERVFPDAQVVEGAGSDYRFRATVPRSTVAEAVSRRLRDIDYGNFKNSVREPARHGAYFDVWHALYGLQEKAKRRTGLARG